MATNHDVNLRADGPVITNFHQDEKTGNSCLTIITSRQKIQIICTGKQADAICSALRGDDCEPEPDMDDRAETVTPPALKKKAAKKKATKKKATKKKRK